MDRNADKQESPIGPLDPIARAALALHRRPGSYVVILGAGISKPTGVPSAWEMLEALIQEAAAALGEDPPDAVEWWFERTGEDPKYSEVLEQLAATPAERTALLKRFFERTADDEADDKKRPSDAHKHLARLVAGGWVRVIVTLNFDHLMEEALRVEGVEPSVIVGAQGISEMEPLHAQQSAVIHLHGEYLSPVLLNTQAELGEYPPPVEQLLRQITDEYGLIVVGWSAAWDKRLVEMLTPQSASRFSTWWIEPGEFNATQRELATLRQADEVHASADDALARLTESLEAVVAESRRSRPLDISVAVASMKRDFHAGVFGIRSHDIAREALAKLEQSAAIGRTDFNSVSDIQSMKAEGEAMLNDLRPAAAIISVLSYWGDERTDRWWLTSLEGLAHRPHVNGLTALIALTRAPAMVLAYSAGAAAVAAERWDLVFKLIRELTTEDELGSKRGRLLGLLTPGSCGIVGGSERLCGFVTTLLRQHLGLSAQVAIDAWERFEYFCSLTAIEGDVLPWAPHMRVEGLGPSEERAAPAVWLDGHLGVIQPFLNARDWVDGVVATTLRGRFDTAFKGFADKKDSGVLVNGSGIYPSSRHYPGRFDDKPPSDG